ncbi:MAG TPA: FeoA family protein [Caulobacteraceae bacterium]
MVLHMSSKVRRSGRPAGEVFALSAAGMGDAGVIVRVGGDTDLEGLGRSERERRLLEMGFVEGARITVLHEGFIGRDPIAVQLDDMRVALRRREAAEVMVQSLAKDD